MRRYPYIDVARGIGMVLVVAGHAMGISMYLTCFFMQLFFVLSGYVYRQGKSYKQNMKRKTERLLVPYFLGSIVLLGIYKVLGRTTKEMLFSGIGVLYSRYCFYNMDIAAEKNNIFFLDIANGAMWYLTSLFTAGAVYYAVIDVGKIANFTSMEYRYCICRCGSDDCRDFVRAKLQYRKMEEKVDFLYSSFVFCAGKSESGN